MNGLGVGDKIDLGDLVRIGCARLLCPCLFKSLRMHVKDDTGKGNVENKAMSLWE